MPCDHQLLDEQLFAYLDDSLTALEKKHFEQTIGQCDACLQTFLQARKLHQAAQAWKAEPVPEWHRTAFAVRKPMSHWNWINISALASSAVALMMVVFQVQISSSNQGFNVSFGGVTQNQIEEMISQRIDTNNANQSLLLDARLVSENDKQLAASQVLKMDIMEKVRKERYDDLNFVVTGIQTQRFEDISKAQKRYAMLTENQIENNRYISQLLQSANHSQGEPQ